MIYINLLPYLIALAGITMGTFFGVAGNKLVSSNNLTNLKWIFYFLGVTSIVVGVIFIVCFFKSLDLYGTISTITLIVSGIALFILTYRILDIKYIFRTKELAPIINNWTSNADHREIKLFGGDLSFFGNPFSEMNSDLQYTFLKSKNFSKISILCEEPKNNESRIRYGKIIDELSNVELKFYKPEEADLQIRGRLKTLNGVAKLLVYFKIKSGKYQTIETDTANSSGALYNNIWDLTWSLARSPLTSEKEGFVKAFKSK